MLKNYWYVACTSDELGARPVDTIICNEPIVVFRQADRSPAILRNVCPHRQAPLSMGKVQGNTLRCAYHGMEFDGAGRCIHIPSQDVIPPKAHVRSYPAAERYGFIWIWPGDPALADTASLPLLPWREETGWNADIIQYFHVRGSHMLMNDNLLDLSHVAFLHENSIGFDARRLDNDPLEVTIEGHYISTRRVFKNTIQAPAHKAWKELAEPIDRTQLAEWRPPYNINVLARNENGKEQVDLRADHFITPETGESHHYYVAMARNFRIDDASFSKQMDADARRVHMEDLEIAEAQQNMKQWTGNAPDMALKADKAVNASHRMIKQLLETEKNAGATA